MFIMPVIKNRLFQPTGALLRDGRMLHFQPREECGVSATDLDSPHVQSLIESGQWALRERDGQGSAAASPEPTVESTLPAPSESEPAQAPESPRPKRRAAQPGARHEEETE
jgi:hypothetical protein